MKTFALAAALSVAATAGLAAPEKYVLDPSHSQIVFSYEHLGFSTTYGMFSGFDGEIIFDQEEPEASSVTVSFPVTSMLTGWEQRFDHFMSGDFFGADANDTVTFTSTDIELTGDTTAEPVELALVPAMWLHAHPAAMQEGAALAKLADSRWASRSNPRLSAVLAANDLVAAGLGLLGARGVAAAAPRT